MSTCNSEIVFLDLETHAINKASSKPPIPVGLAYKRRDEEPVYLAFGHETNNNATKEDAYQVLKEVYDSDARMCFHNGVFDLNVIREHFGLAIPDASRIEDTMLLAFVVDPEMPEFGLKDLCSYLLKMPATERDDLKVYLKERFPKTKPKEIMGHICSAPGDLVTPYAKGDVVRTELLFDHLWLCLDKRYRIQRKYDDPIPDTKLLEAYDREKRIAIMFGYMRYTGVRVDVDALKRDVDKISTVLAEIDEYFIKLIGQKINFNSSAQILEHFFRLDLLDKNRLLLTETGQYSTNAESMEAALVSKEISSIYRYMKSLKSMSKTYMQKWISIADENNGYIFTDWKSTGARTGRITSSPNLQNIPNTYDANELFDLDGESSHLPKYPLATEPMSPKIRSYVLPYYEGHKIITVDYSQQELRLLAHYEQKVLLKQYLDDPDADLHKYVAAVMSKKFKKIEKPQAKALNFTIIYGGGKPRVSKQLNISLEDAAELMKTHRKIFPTIYDVKLKLESRAHRGLPFYTFGGRRYFAKQDAWTGDIRTNVLINTLIQSGSADMTKMAMVIYFYTVKHPDTIVLLSTHDEATISAPAEIAEAERDKLVQVMESIKCRTPLKTSSNIADNLAECK